MKITTAWYVITGASCSGKSTTIDLLEKRGYRVVHETARTIIDQGLAKGLTIQEVRKDEHAFQSAVLDMKIEIEKHLDPKEVVFLDRGIPDTCAYEKLYKITPDPSLQEALTHCAYKKIFILDQLPYAPDFARIETDEEQNKLHQFLEETYRCLGFEIVKVPAIPINERIEFILGRL